MSSFRAVDTKGIRILKPGILNLKIKINLFLCAPGRLMGE
jgi:hypothetical protein